MSKDRHMSKDQALDILDAQRPEPGSRRTEWRVPDGRRARHSRSSSRFARMRGLSEKEAELQIKDYKLHAMVS